MVQNRVAEGADMTHRHVGFSDMLATCWLLNQTVMRASTSMYCCATRGLGQEMQQPTKPDRMTKNYTTGRDDEMQCVNETRRNTTAASDMMASRDDKMHEGKQGQDAAQKATTNKTKQV
jgi:hypothetical protein